ncbi:hypothetical protein L9F63_026003, partial [Diploptera punctata]
IADGQRDVITKLSLKTRKFIGNTSMDPQLSLYMANQALVQYGDIVLDPFVGTGSLLVAASHFGGYVLGSDIDFLMLHGKTRPTRVQKKFGEKNSVKLIESIHTNLQQYGRANQYLDVICGRCSSSLWKQRFKRDRIITDRSYILSEKCQKGKIRNMSQMNPMSCSFVRVSKFLFCFVYGYLFSFAAQHLKMGGRLVCWIPIVKFNHSPHIFHIEKYE